MGSRFRCPVWVGGLLAALMTACFGGYTDECASDADCCGVGSFTLCHPTSEGNKCRPSTLQNSACTGGYCDTTVLPEAVSLPVPELPQLCSQWCWAATATMVLNYYGVLGHQCYAVDSTGRCCFSGVCESACNQPGRPDHVLTYEGFHGIRLERALDEVELQHELANGRPVIAHFLAPGSSHFVVVSGYQRMNEQPTRYHLIDPLNWSSPWAAGTAPYVADLSYDELFAGPTGAQPWSVTYARISPRRDGCSPIVNPSCACDSAL